MNVSISKSQPFQAFSIQIDIENTDELRALTRAADSMTNGHGLQLYDLLQSKCAACGIHDFPDRS